MNIPMAMPTCATWTATRVVAPLVVAVVGLAGCGGGGSSSSARDAGTNSSKVGGGGSKGVLTIGLQKAPTTLDPTLDSSGQQVVMRSLSNEAFVHQEPDGSFTPALATKWRYIGSGNRTFEMTLRPDAKFSDGTAVNAKAVKAWLEYYAAAKGAFAALLPFKSIETIGTSTVRMRFTEPSPVVPLLLSGCLSNWGDVSSPTSLDKKTLSTKTVGAGPYVLVPSATVQGDHYTFVPNKYYYDQAAIRYSKVIVKIIASPTTMLQAAKTGQIQFAVGDTTTADAAAAGGLNVVKAPAGVAGLVLLDRKGTLAKPLGDVRVRQALNYALDRNAINAGLAGKYGTPSSVLPSTDGFDPALTNHYPYDPQKAKALLKAAGYPNGFSMTVLDASFYGAIGGSPVTQAMAKYLSAVGVKLKVTTAATSAEYGQKIFTKKYAGLMVPWDSNPMWYQYAILLGPKAVLNLTGATRPALDDLYAKGASADPEAAAAHWKLMTKSFVETGEFVPAFAYDFIYYASPRLKGVEVSAKAFYPFASRWSPA